jgi:hypothetical protein
VKGIAAVSRSLCLGAVLITLMLTACEDTPDVSTSPNPSRGTTVPGPNEGMPAAGMAAPLPPSAPELVLPDLQAMPPHELWIQVDPETETRRLRFSTVIVNGGPGRLELRGVQHPATGTFGAFQIISTQVGAEVDRHVGTFVFHAEHNHWHFEDFTELELWSYLPGPVLVRQHAATGKASFCLSDTDHLDPSLPNSPASKAFVTCELAVQGISPGWGDTYFSTDPGQELDITGLPDGRYAIRSTADPTNRVQEADDANNSVIAFIEIRDGHVTMLQGP